MTSRCMIYKGDHMKDAFRMHYEEQSAILNELKNYVNMIQFSSKTNYFQKGISINSVFALHKDMKEKYDLPYLMTSRLDQNYLEVFNSKMRLADRRGANRDPTALMLNY